MTAPAASGLPRAVAVMMAGHAFSPLATLATAPILAHALGVDGRGAVAAVTAPVVLATTAGTLGVPASVQYFLARHAVRARGLVGRGLVLVGVVGAVVSGVVLLLGPWFAGGDPELDRLLVVAVAAVVPSLVVLVWQALAAARGRWALVTAERFITSSARLLALSVLAATGTLTVATAVLVLAFSPVLGGLAYLGLLRRGAAEVPLDVVGGRRAVGSAELLGYGARVWIGSISGVLLARLDQALLTPLVGVQALGVYVAAVTVAEVPRIVSDAARDVMMSVDARDSDDARLGRVARLTTAFVGAVSVLAAVNLGWAVPVFFGADFRPAVAPAVLLLSGSVAGSGAVVAGIALVSRGFPGRRSVALAVSCVVNVVLVVVLVPRWGVMGAAAATVGGTVVLGVLNVWYLHRCLGVAPTSLLGLRRSDLTVVAAGVRARLARG